VKKKEKEKLTQEKVHNGDVWLNLKEIGEKVGEKGEELSLSLKKRGSLDGKRKRTEKKRVFGTISPFGGQKR